MKPFGREEELMTRSAECCVVEAAKYYAHKRMKLMLKRTTTATIATSNDAVDDVWPERRAKHSLNNGRNADSFIHELPHAIAV
jgi:hypothetical protein